MVTKREQESLRELAEVDRRGRSPRTAGQVGLGGAVFVILDYVLRGFFDIDLDPVGDGTEMPVIVTVAFTTIAAYLVALYMNRKRPVADEDVPEDGAVV